MYNCTLSKLKKMKDIEVVAYPSFMRSICDCDDLEDVADYCECKVSEIFCVCSENYYLLAANKKDSVEVVDFASTGRCIELFKVINICLKQFEGKIVTMDCRELTSYPIVTLLLKRKGISYNDEPWDWNGEIMHEISFQL